MLVDLAVPGSGPFREKERSMSTPSVEILSRAEWPGQGRREECEVSAPRAHRWGREEEKVGILSHDASTQAQKTKLLLPKGKEGEGQIRNLGLTDTHYYIYNR